MRVGVFCGSRSGRRRIYRAAARELGEALAQAGIGIVYGGAGVGLMGALADAALGRGAEVIGVIPEGLIRREVAHPRLTALHTVGSMHARKALMAELADAFIVLPGGTGTLDELFEIWTWAQLGYHDKPFGLLEVGQYFAALLRFLDRATEEGFLPEAHRAWLTVSDSPVRLIEELTGRLPGREPPEATRTPIS